MLFNSYAFILFFLPVVWILYFGLNHLRMGTAAQIVLTVASFFFYGYSDPKLCLLLGSSVAVNYVLHYCMTEEKMPAMARRLMLAAGLVFNLGLIFYFKYFDFFIENLNRAIHSNFALKDIVLPLGISFFTFQQVSFLIDTYRKEIDRSGFVEYALFVSFFPQLVAGPIVLHKEMLPQFRDSAKRKVNYENLQEGLEYFIWGFAKKVIVADAFAKLVDAGYAMIPELNRIDAALVILGYTLQIYFDFSGYCDMALGLGRFFNIELPINFDSPYKARTIGEFWKKWHATLTRFLTTYVYIPLGGSRRGTARTCLNVMIVFAVSGLWHGAAWTFVVWGVMHGIAMVVYRVGRRRWDRLPGFFLWLCTFAFVNGAWAFFRAPDLLTPLRLFKRIFIGAWGGISQNLIDLWFDGSMWSTFFAYHGSTNGTQIAYQVILLLWFVFWTGFTVFAPSTHDMVKRKIRQVPYYIVLGCIFTWSLMCLSKVSTFIYFNF